MRVAFGFHRLLMCVPQDVMYTAVMAKSFLLIWLIISTLGYGSVWAFGGHVDVVDEHQGVVGDVDNAPGDDGDHHSCDHCCHASAHTVALAPFQSSTAYSGTCAGHTPYLHTYSFYTTSPPERPPQG